MYSYGGFGGYGAGACGCGGYPVGGGVGFGADEGLEGVGFEAGGLEG